MLNPTNIIIVYSVRLSYLSESIVTQVIWIIARSSVIIVTKGDVLRRWQTDM